MKKIFIYILSIFSLISLSGCDFVNDNNDIYIDSEFVDFYEVDLNKIKIDDSASLLNGDSISLDYEIKENYCYLDFSLNYLSNIDFYEIIFDGFNNDKIYLINYEILKCDFSTSYTCDGWQEEEAFIEFYDEISSFDFNYSYSFVIGSDSNINEKMYSEQFLTSYNKIGVNFTLNDNLEFSNIKDKHFLIKIKFLELKHNYVGINYSYLYDYEDFSLDEIDCKVIDNYMTYTDIVNSITNNINYYLISVDSFVIENGDYFTLFAESEVYINYDSKICISYQYQDNDGNIVSSVVVLKAIEDKDGVIINFFDKVWNWISENIINYSS